MWIYFLGAINAVIIIWAFLKTKIAKEEVNSIELKKNEEVLNILYDLNKLQELYLPERTERVNAYIKLQTSIYASKIRKMS